jgi:WD40 repeat protein
MMSSSLDATHKIWDLREGQLLFTLRGHEGATTAAAFSDNGAYFATGGTDSMVREKERDTKGGYLSILKYICRKGNNIHFWKLSASALDSHMSV